MRRLMREISELKNSPPEGIRISTNEDNMLDVTGIIQGPEGTPYSGGYFRVKFKFTEEFPAAPPKCWFATKIFHPNVSSSGEICVNTLKKDWKSVYGITHILVTVKCLLIYPNPESALDEEAGKLLLENYDSYCDRAKLITSVHATPRVKPVEFEATPTTTNTSNSPISIPPLPTGSTSTVKLTPTPPVSRKSPSPIHPLLSSSSNMFPLASTENSSTAASSTSDKEGNKERHPSPSPLSTADANVGGGGKGLTTMPMPASKAVKRSATGGTGVEKRKKALKRL